MKHIFNILFEGKIRGRIMLISYLYIIKFISPINPKILYIPDYTWNRCVFLHNTDQMSIIFCFPLVCHVLPLFRYSHWSRLLQNLLRNVKSKLFQQCRIGTTESAESEPLKAPRILKLNIAVSPCSSKYQWKISRTIDSNKIKETWATSAEKIRIFPKIYQFAYYIFSKKRIIHFIYSIYACKTAGYRFIFNCIHYVESACNLKK